MTSFARTETPPWEMIDASNRQHAILRGEFPALVFSGDRTLLGELPGELTAATLFKFALPDPRLSHDRDFASTPGMPLPLWPAGRIIPTDGVCFVFSDESNPHAMPLEKSGGVRGEHFATIEDVWEACNPQGVSQKLARLLDTRRGDGPVLLLGFGDQGKRIAYRLREEFELEPFQIAVIDDHPISAASAAEHGYQLCNRDDLINTSVVIYTPLLRYADLYLCFERLRREDVLAIDNSKVASLAQHFRDRGRIWLEASANRALRVNESVISLRDHGLPINVVQVVREDRRALAGKEFPHLSAFHRMVFGDSQDSADLLEPGSADRLSRATFRGLNRAYVSLRERPDAAVFAARDLCARLWPLATAAAFPASCVADLGVTPFERIIKRHLDGAEMITASQTSTQQVALGIAARHYAADSPIVEIGSALGGSGAIMAAATSGSNAEFLSIDPETATRHVMRWAFEQQHQSHRLHQILRTSDDAVRDLQHLRGKAGVVFIDGLHTEAAMSGDFEHYAPLVRPGGALLIHDVEPARYSVLRVVIERVLKDKRFAARCMIDGLLILERQ